MPDPGDAAHDIDIDEFAAGVLAGLDFGDMPTVETDEHDGSRCHPLAGADRDMRPPVCRGERHLEGRRLLPGLVNRGGDCGTLRADRLEVPVDDDLRRIDRRQPEQPRVALLPGGRGHT
ncbi:MAG TPA: hypothetical protein VM755_18270 [Stellaceae bacterium]|nr:hypothetical protein [Stellaceae bacterium]